MKFQQQKLKKSKIEEEEEMQNDTIFDQVVKQRRMKQEK